MSDDNLVFLAFTNPNADIGEKDLLTCAYCRNKTFIARCDMEEFPVLICAACNGEIGPFGWAD